MRHKHYELILAWAEGAEIECKNIFSGVWFLDTNPSWQGDFVYRIKPEPKPDVIYYQNLYRHGKSTGSVPSAITTSLTKCKKKSNDYLRGIVKFVICAETGKLKSAEVL